MQATVAKLAALAAVILAVGVATVVVAGPGEQGPATIRAALLRHSGLVDPQWEFSEPSDIETLKAFVADLSPAVPPSWPQFGHRGIMLENNGVSGFPPLVRVFEEVLQIYDEAGGSEYFQDVNHMEPWLLDRMPDFDGDGFASRDELATGTDPIDPDTDDDGHLDGAEMACGSNPFDPASGCP